VPAATGNEAVVRADAEPIVTSSLPLDQTGKPVSGEFVWRGPRVVLVHDWIGGVHGAEQVLREFAVMFPDAPILTLFADERVLPVLGIEASRVQQSYLGRVPNAVRFRKWLVPWFADAVQSLDVGDAELIVSSSHAVAKNIPHRSYQTHLSYVYSPLRYVHELMQQHVETLPFLLRPFARGRLRSLGVWDVATTNGVTEFVAISRAVAARVWKVYRRESSVLCPPVDVGGIPVGRGSRDEHYVVVSRLVSYKRVDVAIRAAAVMRRRLVIVGDGPERPRLEALATELRARHLVEFTGWVDNSVKHDLLGRARALLFPGEEDFGIVGVEALACGTPVVALGRGGMLDVVDADARPMLSGPAKVIPGGVLVSEQTGRSLAEGIRLLEDTGLPSATSCRALSERFATPEFRRRFLALAQRVLRSE
jgi:glycosyltransferase involved in cell wall biosynthesis